jgi:hypothetical protein
MAISGKSMSHKHCFTMWLRDQNLPVDEENMMIRARSIMAHYNMASV